MLRALIAMSIIGGAALVAVLAAGGWHVPFTGLPLALNADTVIDAATRFLREAVTRVGQGYGRTPEMILGLGLALGLPVLWMISAMVRASARAYRRRQRLQSLRPAMRGSAMPANDGPAFLEISEGEGRRTLHLAHELTRIGCDRENEVPIDLRGVDQLHALIRRTFEADYLIVDVSRRGGPGVTINGERRRASRLKDGDCIGLGTAAVTFRRPARAAAGSGGRQFA